MENLKRQKVRSILFETLHIGALFVTAMRPITQYCGGCQASGFSQKEKSTPLTDSFLGLRKKSLFPRDMD